MPEDREQGWAGALAALAARRYLAWSLVVTLAAMLAFVVPAWRRAGMPPAPLDDTFIYYGHARSWALGHPFAWYPGNGYSSGATSVIYPLLLAPLWGLGLRGAWLGIGALALAVVACVDWLRSLERLIGDERVAWWLPVYGLSIPLLGWSLWSGMETALFLALLGRSLLGAEDAVAAPPPRRAAAQWRVGGWLALTCLTRPEAVVLAAVATVAVVHGARSLSTVGSLRRVGGPWLLALGLQALMNLVLTGEASPAGAVRKLVWSSPSATPSESLLQVAENAVVLVSQAFLRALGGPVGLLLALGLAAVALRARPRLSLVLGLGLAGGFILVCQNATARFQNYRYAAPLLAMGLALGALALGAIARRRPRLAAALALAAIALASRELPGQQRHFALASANVAEQHGVVAARLAALQPRRVLVNDAGAIPYLGEVPPLDGLGLGGSFGLPFARASVHGVLGVVELIERLEPARRPDYLAVYPGWWPGVVDVFGERIDAVRIEHNVICAAEEKVIYRADWHALAPPDERRPDQIDELDVADLVSERRHRFDFPRPSLPLVAAIRRLGEGEPRWDAGRVVRAGEAVSFLVADEVVPGAATLLLRGGRGPFTVSVIREGRAVAEGHAPAAAAMGEAWGERGVSLATLAGGDRLRIVADREPLEVHHLWLLRLGHGFAPDHRTVLTGSP